MAHRTFLICLNLESALVVSAEPLSYDEDTFDGIRKVISARPEYFKVLDRMLNGTQSETKGKSLTRAIRELVAVLRADIDDGTKRMVIGLIDDCSWALEREEALCVWTEYVDPQAAAEEMEEDGKEDTGSGFVK